MNIDIVPVPPASSVNDPLDPLYEAYVEVDKANEIDLTGNDDLAAAAHAVQVGSVDRTYYDIQRWVAFPEGERTPSSALGTAFVQYDLAANTHLAETVIVVRPDVRSQGVGKALMDPLARSISESGRTIIATWTETRPYEGEDALIPKSGVGRIDPNNPAHRWLSELGFDLEQAGRRNMLALPADGEAWWSELEGRLERDREKAGPDYEIIQWRGAVPSELRDQIAHLRTRMSTDEPHAGMDYGEVRWDAARIEKQDTKIAQRGYDRVTTAVRHAPSGDLVAYTELYWEKKRPAAVDQEDTFVLAGHRGHRLGALLKAANLAALRQANPESRRIYTWNAGENQYMLAINEELGFEIVTVEGSWQKRL